MLERLQHAARGSKERVQELYTKLINDDIAIFEGYDTGATDFAPFINKIPADADAVMGGGHFADGSTFAGQLFKKGMKTKFIALLVAQPRRCGSHSSYCGFSP